MFPVKGGYLRFNRTLRRLDAHCTQAHCKPSGCKMDRSIAKGVVGLQLAWLAHETTYKEMHDVQKGIISSEAELELRTKARAEFSLLASTHGGLPKEILDFEKEIRGSNDEPLKVSGSFK